jgi:hypothetical protein
LAEDIKDSALKGDDHSDKIPANNHKWAVQKQMLQCFFSEAIAEDATIRVKLQVSPSEDVSGAESIFDEQPKEDHMLRLTVTFPKPPVNRMNHRVANQEPIDL